MASSRALSRSAERLDRLTRSSMDDTSLRLEAIADLRRVIGFDRYCWPVADPQTLLPMDAIADHDYGPGVPRALFLEYSGRDFAAKHELALRSSPATSLSAETGGDLAISLRWDEVMRGVGIGDVAVVACRDRLGTWGWLEAYRDRDDPPFTEAELELLGRVAGGLGSAMRRRVTAGAPTVPAEPKPPGVLIVDHDLKVVSTTAGARAWLDAMPGAEVYAALGMLPAAFYAAASLALSRGDGSGSHALSRTVDGRWLTIEVAPLNGPHEGWVAVDLRTATAPETFDLLCRAYGLTKRERAVTALLLEGLDTRAISRRLSISRYTIQDHLKAVFDKVGICSRGELRARLSSAIPGELAGAFATPTV